MFLFMYYTPEWLHEYRVHEIFFKLNFTVHIKIF